MTIRRGGPPTPTRAGEELRKHVESIRAERKERIAKRMPKRGPRGRFITESEALQIDAREGVRSEPVIKAEARSVMMAVEEIERLGNGAYAMAEDYVVTYHAVQFVEPLSLAKALSVLDSASQIAPESGRVMVAVQMEVHTDEGEVFNDWRSLSHAIRADVAFSQAASEIPTLKLRYHAVNITAVTVAEW